MRLYQYYTSIDPGLTRLRLAVKALCIALITLAINMAWLAPLPVFISSLSAALIYSCHQGESRPKRKWTIVMAGISMAAMVLLGSVLRHFYAAAIVVLVLVSFFAFYLSRFGERYRLFPVLSSLFYILSVFLFLGRLEQVIALSSAILVSTAIAFAMYVYIWPDQPRQIARHYVYHSFMHFHGILKQFKVVLMQRLSRNKIEEMRPLIKQGIIRTTEIMILIDHLGLAPERYDLYQRFTIKLYATSKLLAMIWESLLQLSPWHQNQTLIKDLLPVLREFCRLSDQLLQSYQSRQQTRLLFDIQPLQALIKNMQQHVFMRAQSLPDQYTIHLLNLLFGLQRLQHRFGDMHQLLVERDELNQTQ